MPEEKKNNLPESIKELPKENQTKILLRSLLQQKLFQSAVNKQAAEKEDKPNTPK